MKWLAFLGKYYKEQKKANPDYKYKQAMKDAVKPYRKQLSGGADPEVEPPKTEPAPEPASASEPAVKTEPASASEPAVKTEPEPASETETETDGGRRRSRKGRRSAKKRRRTSKRR